LESKPSLKKILIVEEAQWSVPCRRDFDPPSIGEVMVSELRKRGYGIILIVHHFQEIPWTTFFDVGTKIGLSPDSLPRNYVETMLALSPDPKKRRRQWERLTKKMLVLHNGELTVHGKPKPFKGAGATSAKRRFLHRFCVFCLYRRLRKPDIVSEETLKTATAAPPSKTTRGDDNEVICAVCGNTVKCIKALAIRDRFVCHECYYGDLVERDAEDIEASKSYIS